MHSSKYCLTPWGTGAQAVLPLLRSQTHLRWPSQLQRLLNASTKRFLGQTAVGWIVSPSPANSNLHDLRVWLRLEMESLEIIKVK